MQKLIQYLDQHFEEDHTILLYTSWGLEQYWSDLYPEKLASHLQDVNCSFRDCQISYDKEMLPRASAVLFHGQDLGADELYSPDSLRELQRPSNQIWIWVNQESPMNIKNAEEYNGFFNWTATYHRKSDIVLPYGRYVAQNIPRDNGRKKQLSTLPKSKTGFVAWAVSDCGGEREKFVLQLEKFLNVTVFGKCSTTYRNQGTCIRGTDECEAKLSGFRFYLAFENSLCEDYVTEKYWINALEHNSLPIVYGYNYDENVAIPGSYVNAKNFKTAEELAKYIQFLDKNDRYYAKYFKWKRKYNMMHPEDLICTVCKKLHDKPLYRRVYNDLGQFWNKDMQCITNS